MTLFAKTRHKRYVKNALKMRWEMHWQRITMYFNPLEMLSNALKLFLNALATFCNALATFINAFHQCFPTRWNYFWMHWQRFAMRWQLSSMRWTTHCKLHNCVGLTIDCFACHANQRPSILWNINKTLLQVLGLCLPKLQIFVKMFRRNSPIRGKPIIWRPENSVDMKHENDL